MKKVKTKKTKKIKNPWKVVGLDTFSSESYALESFPNETAALKYARKRLENLEKSQPSSSSGGQGFFGIQDRVFIERPDGSSYRV